MACLDSCCSLIVFSSTSCDGGGSGGVAHILCFAFVTFPSRPLDNRSFTVVRDILSVKVRMCLCVCDEIKASIFFSLLISRMSMS